MEGLSEHTRLLNITIGLSLRIPNWPGPLKELGYSPEVIEANMPEANPDLILTNKKYNHSLIVDCKSRTIEEKQTKKYVEIRNDPQILIRRGVVNVPVIRHYSACPVYISFHDLTKEKQIVENKIHFLHVVEENNELQIIESKTEQFQRADLNKIFPIDLKGKKPPYALYPFDVEDTQIFKIYILRELFNIALHQQNSFTEEELLKNTHKCRDIISEHKKKIFRNIAKRILHETCKSELREYLKSDENKWNIKLQRESNSIKAFQKRCEDAIKSLDDKLKQKQLLI